MTRTVDRNGGCEFVLPMVAICPHRPEDAAPGQPYLCLECGCPVTPGEEHAPHDERCLLGLGEAS
jgi:hypothetical protein